MDSAETMKYRELMCNRNRTALEQCTSTIVKKCLFSRMQGKGLVLIAKRRECREKEPVWTLGVFFCCHSWPPLTFLIPPLTAPNSMIWRAVSLLNKLCWCYTETTLIKVCMWWVRKRRAFKLTESGPVRGKKKSVRMTQGKAGRCKKPFGLSSVDSGQGRSNAEAQGGELRTGSLPSLSTCSVLLV